MVSSSSSDSTLSSLVNDDANHRHRLSASHKRKKSKRKRKKFKSEKEHSKATKRHLEEYVFDRQEAMRLTIDLIKTFPSLRQEMRSLYERLDCKDSVVLTDLPDKSLRKKLRHTFKAFHLDVADTEKEKSWRKPKACKQKLTRLYDSIIDEIDIQHPDLLPSLRDHTTSISKAVPEGAVTETYDEETAFDPKVHHKKGTPSQHSHIKKGPTMPTRDDIEELDEWYAAESSVSDKEVEKSSTPKKAIREAWMTEAPSLLSGIFNQKKAKKRVDRFEERQRADESKHLKEAMDEYNKAHRSKSLLEMHKEGKFKDEAEAQKKYISTHQLLGGGDALYTKASSKKRSTHSAESDPWQTFDRERDLNIKKQIVSEDFHRLLDRSKQLRDRFGESQFQSSFL